MIGKLCRWVLNKISGRELYFSLKCLTSNFNWENQLAQLSNCAWGKTFCLNYIIFRKYDMSISMRKCWPTRWYSNIPMPFFSAIISLYMSGSVFHLLWKLHSCNHIRVVVLLHLVPVKYHPNSNHLHLSEVFFYW